MDGRLELWPSKRADMNPLDYGKCNIIQQKLRGDNPQTLVDLGASVLKRINDLTGSAMRRRASAFRKRVQACRYAYGGLFGLKLKSREAGER